MSDISNPSYYKVVEPMLRAGDDDVRALLRAYPNFDAEGVPKDTGGHSYLHQACFKNHLKAVRVLLKHGASLLRMNKYGQTALHLACCSAQSGSIVEWLLSQFAEARTTVNWADCSGWTPLNSTVYWGKTDRVRILLLYGADATWRGVDNLTPAQWARRRGDTAVAEMLETAERAHTVLALGEWRPHRQACFPPGYRAATRTLVVLSKARTPAPENTAELRSHYPRACLDLLPEELLQYLFAYLTTPHVPDVWTSND